MIEVLTRSAQHENIIHINRLSQQHIEGIVAAYCSTSIVGRQVFSNLLNNSGEDSEIHNGLLQFDFNSQFCGFASLGMVLQTYGDKIDPVTFIAGGFVDGVWDGRSGAKWSALLRYGQSLLPNGSMDFNSFYTQFQDKKKEIECIREIVQEGVPVIARVPRYLDISRYGVKGPKHFVIINGANKDGLFIIDPDDENDTNSIFVTYEKWMKLSYGVLLSILPQRNFEHLLSKDFIQSCLFDESQGVVRIYDSLS